MPKFFSLKKLIRPFSRPPAPNHPPVETSREQQLNEQLLLHEFLKNTHEGVRIIDTKGFIVGVSRAYCRMTGYTHHELAKMNIRDIDFPDSPDEVASRTEEVIKKRSGFVDMRQRRKDGSFFDAVVSSTFLNVSGGILVSVCRDITIIKENQAERSLIFGLLLRGNQPGDERRFMTDAVELLKKWSGCEAAGIRVMDGDDYPYYVTTGFEPGYVEAANHLCARDETGLPVKDSNGMPVLKCMCAEVIRGHIDIAQPFFSPGGSFWTNSVTALVAGGTRQQLASLAGGNCYATRYESLALIPLKWGDVNIGLIQLNDRRPGRFSPSSITSLEHAAIIVAAGLVSRGATEELRRSEEKYRLIVEASLEGILVADHEFRLIYVNDALAKMLGYSPDELVGKDVQDFFYDPPGPEPDKHLESRRAGQDEIHERRFRHKDGHPVWTIVSAKSLKDEAGSFAGSFAMITDISRIKKLEEELRQSAKQYRTLVETIPDVLTRLDRQLRFTNVSSNMTQYTGIPHHLFIGKTHRETGLPAQMCDFAEDTIKKVFVTERPMETEFTFNGPEGEKIINWRVIPEPDAQGLINSVITLGRDITEHRRTEREYQTLFREMFDGFAVHEIILDDEGKPVDYRFLDVNPAFERLTGLRAEDVVGRRILEIMPDTESHWIEAYGRVALTGEPAFFELHHSGLGKDFQISAYRPAPLQCANIFIDITEKKRVVLEKNKIQAQLFQAQKMESVGLLASGVAHDFNNKLGVIMGNAEIALELLDESHPAYSRLKEIVKASSLSADLTRQLLTFARKQEIYPRVLDLNQALGNIFKMLDRLIGEDIKLVYEAGENLWPVKIDPAQLDQIMANLCVNARDAIHGSGSVTVTTANVSLDAAYCAHFNGLKPGDYVRLTVADTGSGMSEEVKKHLFDPFFTTKEGGKGTGLGLATVYGAVKQNNGYIYAESELGKGTVFTIYLPRQTGDADTEAAPQGGKAVGGKETVLIVEDESSILDVLHLLLGHLGYHVLAAASPAEAMTMAGRHRQKIDLLITDVAMPGMNGFELAHALKSSHPHLKVMFISGHTPDGIAHYGELDKKAIFLQKPFTQDMLATKVREALEKEGG